MGFWQLRVWLWGTGLLKMNNFFEYMHFLAAMIMASCWCFGVHAVGHNFFKHALGIDLDYKWDDFSKGQQTIMKPLFACPYCMSSVHGTAIFFVMLFGDFTLWYWLPFCICLCGLNFIVTTIISNYE